MFGCCKLTHGRISLTHAKIPIAVLANPKLQHSWLSIAAVTLLPLETSAFCLQYLRDMSAASLCSFSLPFPISAVLAIWDSFLFLFSSLSDFKKVPLEIISSFLYLQIISFTTLLLFWNCFSYVSGVFYSYT